MQKAVFHRCACIQLVLLLPAACCLLVAHFSFYAAKNPYPPAKDFWLVVQGHSVFPRLWLFLLRFFDLRPRIAEPYRPIED